MVTTIAIDPQTRDRLRTFGMAGDSYDDILQKMMNEIEREEFVRWARKRMTEDHGWIDLQDLEQDLDRLDAADAAAS